MGIPEEKIEKILQFVQINGPREQSIKALKNLSLQNNQFEQGIKELDLVLNLLEQYGLGKSVIADMLIIRGLDYYTGTVFETILPEYKQIGSICSGGRYENLASNYTDQSFPGVGISIGLSRLFYILQTYNLLDDYEFTPVDYALIPLSESEYLITSQIAKKLRQQGKSVDIIYSDKKLGDKMKYAAKIARFAGVIGENEGKTGTVEFKDLITGDKELVKF